MLNRSSGAPAIILVGGGSAFRNTCPALVRSIRKRDNRSVSVVIVDHDVADIEQLERELSNDKGVEVRKVYLHTVELKRDSLAKIITKLKLKGINPDTNPADCPPMIRALIHVWDTELIDAVKDVLPKNVNAQAVRAILCSPFAVTGPTSSLVGLEAIPIIQQGLANWEAQAPHIRKVNVASIGFALVAPDPVTGSSPCGLEHGRNVAKYLTQTMAHGSGPFRRCLLLDGSGLDKGQDLDSYRDWATETAATFLTARPPNQDGSTSANTPFADPEELQRYLPDGASYANIALIRAGYAPEDRDSVTLLAKLFAEQLDVPLPKPKPRWKLHRAKLREA